MRIVLATLHTFGIIALAIMYAAFVFALTFVGHDGTFYNCTYVDSNPQWPDGVKQRCKGTK